MKQKNICGNFNLLAIIIACVFSTLITGLAIGGVFSPIMSYRKAEHYVHQYSAELQTVVDYLNSFQSEDVFCSKSKGYWMVHRENPLAWQEIEDEKVCAAIQCLFDEGRCTNIDKSDQTISFTLFSKNTDVGGGIAFTTSDTLDIQFLTSSKALSMQNWYYYISDYNEWRLQR